MPYTSIQRMQLLAPPMLAMAAALLGFAMLPRFDSTQRLLPSPVAMRALFVISVLLCAMWMATAFSFVHWTFFCAIVLVFAFGGNAAGLCRGAAPFVAAAIALQLVATAVYQVRGAILICLSLFSIRVLCLCFLL